MLCQNFFQQADLNDQMLQNIDDDNSQRGFVLEVDFEYPKELHELHNNYALVTDKLELERQKSILCIKI